MSSTAAEVIRILKAFSGHRHQQDDDLEVFGKQSVEKLDQHILSAEPIKLLLPSFPLKNPNMEKVISRGPDLGEELALKRLDYICAEIRKIYPAGAQLTIVSDGVVYGDLIGVPDEVSFDYGQNLRALAVAEKLKHIEFMRLHNVFEDDPSGEMTKSDYLRATSYFRQELEKFLDPSFDVENELKTNDDTRATYQSFVGLLTADLRWRHNLDQEFTEYDQSYDEMVKAVSKAMVKRLISYERLLRQHFPQHIRLSIHTSSGKDKIYIPLLPREGDHGKNPWNCCVAVTASGEVRTGSAKEFSQKFKLIHRNGQPYFFSEHSKLVDGGSGSIAIQMTPNTTIVKMLRE